MVAESTQLFLDLAITFGYIVDLANRLGEHPIMIEANVLEEKTKLSQLVEAAERGELVFIRNGVSVARIVPFPKVQIAFWIPKGAGWKQFGGTSVWKLGRRNKRVYKAVMPVRSLLLDTHVVIWMTTEPDRLPSEFLSALTISQIQAVSDPVPAGEH